jgi:hypothetical protein
VDHSQIMGQTQNNNSNITQFFTPCIPPNYNPTYLWKYKISKTPFIFINIVKITYPQHANCCNWKKQNKRSDINIYNWYRSQNLWQLFFLPDFCKKQKYIFRITFIYIIKYSLGDRSINREVWSKIWHNQNCLIAFYYNL